MDAVNTQAPDREFQLKYGISYVADLANGKTVDVLMLHGLNRVRDKFIPYDVRRQTGRNNLCQTPLPYHIINCPGDTPFGTRTL